MSRVHQSPSARRLQRGTKVLWAVQIVLALLFLFAGGMKLAMPAARLAQLTGLPGAFMKFIGLAELSGALGLVLPGIFDVRRELTPLAAVGLVTIMSGATALTAEAGQIASAVLPLVVGALAALVARRRWEWLAAGQPSAAAAPEPRRAVA
jgi:uncharacterized membrane protein HdeD (DUF308 family)